MEAKFTRRDFLKIVGAGAASLASKFNPTEAVFKGDRIQDIPNLFFLPGEFDEVQINELETLFCEYINHTVDLGILPNPNQTSLPQVCILPEMNVPFGQGGMMEKEGMFFRAGSFDHTMKSWLSEVSKGKIVLDPNLPIMILRGDKDSTEKTGKVFAHELAHWLYQESPIPEPDQTKVIYDQKTDVTFSYDRTGLVTYSIPQIAGYNDQSNYLREVFADLTEQKLISMHENTGLCLPITEKSLIEQRDPYFPNVLAVLGALDNMQVKYRNSTIKYDQLWEVLAITKDGVSGFLDYTIKYSVSEKSQDEIKIAILSAICRVGEYQGVNQFNGKY